MGNFLCISDELAQYVDIFVFSDVKQRDWDNMTDTMHSIYQYVNISNAYNYCQH